MRVMAERRWLDLDGRTCEVGPATVATVALAFELLPAQLEVCLARRAELAEADAVAILRTCAPDRLARVLSTCVKGRIPRDSQVDVALVVLGLTDLDCVAAALADTAGNGEAPADDLSDGDIAVISIASRFGCAPHAVYDWPYTTFLAAARCLPLLRSEAGNYAAAVPGRVRSIPLDAFMGARITRATPPV